MGMTDPIADMLTRIRNAIRAGHEAVDVPASRTKIEILRILKDEGYIEDYQVVEEGHRRVVRVAPRYTREGQAVIVGLERVSRPGRRVYCGKDAIPWVVGGLGINILSTPRGILTGAACRKLGVGGEVLCNVW